MKNYIKPVFEIIELRPEERLACCYTYYVGLTPILAKKNFKCTPRRTTGIS